MDSHGLIQGLSNEDMEQWKTSFCAFDTAGSEFITVNDVKSTFKALGNIFCILYY